MKVRMGFVSNSSSSSFCIYGVYCEDDEIETPELIQFILDNLEDFKGKTIQDVQDAAEEDGWSELFYALETPLGLEYWSIEGDYGIYVGDSWANVKDDETGRQFKDRVEAKLQKIWPDVKCTTLEEAWRDG